MPRWNGQRTTAGRAKIKATRTQVDNVWFDSAGESRRYEVLRDRQRIGVIRDLILQQSFKIEIDGRPVLIKSQGFPNGRRSTYRADFAYTVTDTGENVFEDFKGHDTYRARFRRAVVEAIYQIEIRVVTRSTA